MADVPAISTATGFDGTPATYFYLDTKTSTLIEATAMPTFDAAQLAPDAATLSVWPRYLNAPGIAEGSTSDTQFKQRGKPNAYLKLQLTQDAPGASNTKAQTWASMYPVIDNPQDDIANVFFDDPVSGDAIELVPLPGGTGELRLVLAAIIGGPKKDTLLAVLDKVLGLANSTAGKALLAIPAADLTLASVVESLANQATTAFAPDTKVQYFIAGQRQSVAISAKAPVAPDVMVLPLGTSFLAAFPSGADDVLAEGIRTIARSGVSVLMDKGGELVARDKATGALVAPNPFANYIYATLRFTVAAAAK